LSKPGSDPWQSSMDGHRCSEPPPIGLVIRSRVVFLPVRYPFTFK
jgi:hypothetical protein